MARRWTLCLIGPFRLLTPEGKEIDLTSSKGRAVLAILALSPRKKRARSILKDLLWSRFQPQQASNNLRNTLTYLTKILGGEEGLLRRNPRDVWLDPAQLDLDVESHRALACAGPHAMLLEDLKVNDVEFQDWLALEQSGFEDRVTALPDTAADRPEERPLAPTEAVQEPAPRSYPVVPVTEPREPVIVIGQAKLAAGGSAAFTANATAHLIARGLVERTGMTALSEPYDGPGIRISIEGTALGTGFVLRIALVGHQTGAIHWTTVETLEAEARGVFSTVALKRLVNHATDVGFALLSGISNTQFHPEVRSAIAIVQQMLTLTPGTDFTADDAVLQAAHERVGAAVFLAWRAYLRCFQVGESAAADPQMLADEAEAMMREALFKAPGNATALALAAHVFSFLLRQPEQGLDMAERSLELSPHNALGLAFLGRAKSYLGDYEAGYRATSLARQIAGPGNHRATVDVFAAINALLHGRHAEAMQICESLRILAPGYKPPQRLLLPLYLHHGRRNRAHALIERMRRSEPDFSLQMLREQSYPSRGLRQSGLLRFTSRDL